MTAPSVPSLRPRQAETSAAVFSQSTRCLAACHGGHWSVIKSIFFFGSWRARLPVSSSPQLHLHYRWHQVPTQIQIYTEMCGLGHNKWTPTLKSMYDCTWCVYCKCAGIHIYLQTMFLCFCVWTISLNMIVFTFFLFQWPQTLCSYDIVFKLLAQETDFTIMLYCWT